MFFTCRECELQHLHISTREMNSSCSQQAVLICGIELKVLSMSQNCGGNNCRLYHNRPSIFYASWRLDIDKLLYSADSSEHTSDWRQYQFRGKRPSDSHRLMHPPDFFLHPLFHSSPPTRSLVKVRLKWKLFIFCNFAISDSWYLH